MAQFDVQELSRYARQVRLPEMGVAGQERLKNSSILIVGAGGLGSPAAIYLAAAGVGRLGIVDGDQVDVSNLHRQILYATADVSSWKVDSARATLSALNPYVQVETFAERLTRDNALGIVGSYDVVIDATDNFPTRYLLNDSCVLTGRLLVHGSVDRFQGQVSVFGGKGPCYRCLFPTPPEAGTVLNCADAGVLGVLPGLIGTMQATEALKLVLGLGESLAGRLLILDALRMRFNTIEVDRDPDCPVCGTGEIKSLVDYDVLCGGRSTLDGSTAWAGAADIDTPVATITVRELAQRLKDDAGVLLIDVREPYEWNIARLPGARLIPLGTLETALDAIDPSQEVVVYCHHGMRSETAAYMIRAAGVRRVQNLVGGIDRWSVEIDPSVSRY